MRLHLSIFLLLLAQPAFSDAYKCKGPNGQVVFTESPCENGFSHSSSARTYASDSDNAIRARADLQRQKTGFVSARPISAYLSRHRLLKYQHRPTTMTLSMRA